MNSLKGKIGVEDIDEDEWQPQAPAESLADFHLRFKRDHYKVAR